MKETNKLVLIALVFIIFNLLSCSTQKTPSFNNSHVPFEVKENMQDINSSSQGINESARINSAENTEASVEKVPDLIPAAKEKVNIYPKNAALALSDKQEPEISKAVKEKVAVLPLQKMNKEQKKEIRKEIRGMLKKENAFRTGPIGKALLVIFAIVLPPLAVALVDGFSGPFWLDILLTILFYLPGLIYALYRIFRTT
jgi:uncharacterized membrane protein YqaE (UPF0057 family)